MRRRGRAAGRVGWGAAVLAGVLALPLLFGPLGPPRAAAQDEEDRLEQVERRIAELRSQITAAQSERTELAETIEETQARMTRVKTALAQAEFGLAEAEVAVDFREESVADFGQRIRRLDVELAGTRLEQRLTVDLVKERAAELYMSAALGAEASFLASGDFNTASIRVQYMRNLLAETQVLLSSLEVLERQEQTRQDRLRAEQAQEAVLLAELEADQAKAEEQRSAVAGLRRELSQELALQVALLAQVNEEITDHEGQVAALEAESEELEREILRRQIREGRAPGRLAWPVSGVLTSPFGMRIHPVLGGRRMHNGIDIGLPTGSPIYASANGRVILAERRGGYGRMVVLDHGGGLSTLYAHQSSMAVSVGDQVLAGDVIGYIGCSGYCTGPHLHFEVREVGAPVDPMKYLS